MTRRPGLTLPELIVSIFVLALAVGVIGNLYIGATRFSRDEQLRIDVGENVARVFAVMDETMRQGKTVLVNATIGAVTYTTNTDTLVFTMPSIDVTDALSPVDTDTVVIVPDTTVSGNQRLRMIIDPHANSTREALDRVLVERVKDVYFRYNTPIATNATAVTATLTFEQTVSGRPFTRATILYAAFRNHL